MATTEHAGGIIPATNDLAAGVAIVGAYIARFGTLAEGVEAVWWHLPLILTTDLLLPLLAGLWLLVVPSWSVYRRR